MFPRCQIQTTPERRSGSKLSKHLKQDIDENTFLIGHSVGCQAVLRIIDSLPEGAKAGGVVLVAGWVSVPAWEGRTDEQKAILNDWMNPPLDLQEVARHAKHFAAIFSDDDEFVPKENWRACEEQLHAKVIVKHNAGHFEAKDDSQLPEVIDAVMEMAND